MRSVEYLYEVPSHKQSLNKVCFRSITVTEPLKRGGSVVIFELFRR